MCGEPMHPSCLARTHAMAWQGSWNSPRDPMTRNVAAAGAFVLAALAPFEATAPIGRLPGQSISSLEAIVIASLAAWALSLVIERRLPAAPPLASSWIAFIFVMAVAALAAGPLRANALRMTGRFVAAAAVYCLAVDTLSTPKR